VNDKSQKLSKLDGANHGGRIRFVHRGANCLPLILIRVFSPVWYENLPGVVICQDKSRPKHRWCL